MFQNCLCLGGKRTNSSSEDIEVGGNKSSENEINPQCPQHGSSASSAFVHQHPKHLIKPGNRKYLSHYNSQKGSTSTKPIGSIGAELRGPGPNIVNLPPTIGDKNHDPRRTKAPAYKIGERDPPIPFLFGPGPAEYNTTKLTNKGIDFCCAPKMGMKCTGLEPYVTPGPAAYARGDSDAIAYPHAPAYTMRPKNPPKKKFFGPAPDAYALPETIGPGITGYAGGPAYTIRNIEDMKVTRLGPGPAVYMLPSTDVHKEKPPSYTIRSRTMSKRTGAETPGPASNDMHLVKFHKLSTPRFTFGIRHSPNKAFQRFAPGDD